MPPKNPNKRPLVAVVLAVLLLASLIGNFTLYSSRQDYKTKSDQKAAAAALAATKAENARLSAQFDAANKAPYKTYQGSNTYGSITFSYPKTYSVYTDENGTDTPINAYFYPDQVPSVQSNVAYALRAELVNTAYADVLSDFQSEISAGTVKAVAYVPPKMKAVANVSPGMLLTGPISSENSDAQGSLAVIKVRDKTLKIYTESTAYNSDFNNIVLPSLTFAP